MTVRNAVFMLLVGVALVTVGPPVGMAGEQRNALLKQYWGTIASVRVDRCGKRQGLCEGAITLTQRDGRRVTLAIRPGTWIKRQDLLVLLEDLNVGNDIHVQAVEIAADGGMRATNIGVSTRP
ncbi:MAG TPA: hypothetical protein VLK82_10905 [Candidatus Tectomicrobia bacterium]|nr:hypothetical protein [Candidatus Tectomicrobia bacterium]